MSLESGPKISKADDLRAAGGLDVQVVWWLADSVSRLVAGLLLTAASVSQHLLFL